MSRIRLFDNEELDPAAREQAEAVEAAGGDAAALLAENDSNRALALSNDLLMTGPTGTNVADLQVLALAPRGC